MDFKSHEVVVLPASKFGKVISLHNRKPVPFGLAPPREFKRPSDDLILVMDEAEHETALRVSLPAAEGQGVNAPRVVQVQARSPSRQEPAPDVRKKILISNVTRPREVIPENPQVAEASVEVDPDEASSSFEAIESSQAALEQVARKIDELEKSCIEPGEEVHALSDDPTGIDYIFAYNGKFLGHYRSSKRMTSRKVFTRVAQRLSEDLESFDPRRLELFKPTPLKIDREAASDQLHDESFSWFADSPK